MKKRIVLVLIIICLSSIGISYSFYKIENIITNTFDIAKWNIKVNGTRLTENIALFTINNYVITEDANTNRTSNMLVPGCLGYFDIEIDPEETDVALRYTISIDKNTLPGGLLLTDYEIVGESCGNTFISEYEITGMIQLLEHHTLDETSKITYRIYFDYIDDDDVNVIENDINYGINVLFTVSQVV